MQDTRVYGEGEKKMRNVVEGCQRWIAVHLGVGANEPFLPKFCAFLLVGSRGTQVTSIMHPQMGESSSH